MRIIAKHLADVEEGMTLLDMGEVETLVNVLSVVKREGGTVYLFGNGGSHATASHFANDLMKMARIRAVCVGDMGPSMMAYGNDDGWVNMFYGPVSEMVRAGGSDCLLGISCGGNSENVIRVLEAAAGEWGVLAAGLTGNSEGSAINGLGLDALVHAKYPDIRVQEDIHSIVCHAVVRALQEEV